MNETLNYYNQTAKDFVADTVSADLSQIHQRFLSYLPANATILDLGCGSGRDAKAFIEAGYTVTAVDGAEECCKLAETLIGRPVDCLLFDQLEEDSQFDGIWACASLLHVPFAELPDIFNRIVTALKPGGTFYASFKYGDFRVGRGDEQWFNLVGEKE
ncbi:MAG: hypothetical protein PWP20_1558 [Eubacteriaceae bacterium]|nr:hypothetical protein [Eubacteriaceae bacterium]